MITAITERLTVDSLGGNVSETDLGAYRRVCADALRSEYPGVTVHVRHEIGGMTVECDCAVSECECRDDVRRFVANNWTAWLEKAVRS